MEQVRTDKGRLRYHGGRLLKNEGDDGHGDNNAA